MAAWRVGPTSSERPRSTTQTSPSTPTSPVAVELNPSQDYENHINLKSRVLQPSYTKVMNESRLTATLEPFHNRTVTLRAASHTSPSAPPTCTKVPSHNRMSPSIYKAQKTHNKAELKEKLTVRLSKHKQIQANTITSKQLGLYNNIVRDLQDSDTKHISIEHTSEPHFNQNPAQNVIYNHEYPACKDC